MKLKQRETIILESIGDRQMYSYTTTTRAEDICVNRTEQQAVMLLGAVLGSAIVKMKEGDVVTVDIQFKRKGVCND